MSSNKPYKINIASLGDKSLKGNIQAPASKSSMQRGCAAALLSNGTTIILNPGHSNDDMAALDIIKRLGAEVEVGEEQIQVRSKGVVPVAKEIDCGESGLSIRMFTPLVALSEKKITINGAGSLSTRPMNFFDEILPQLGVKVRSNMGMLPLEIQGPLLPSNIDVDGSLSSQFLTGLLMAYSVAINKPGAPAGKSISIKVNNLKSKPYIDLTLDVMKKFGLAVPENRDYEEFIFHSSASSSSSSIVDKRYTVEGDWSGAAFLLVAGAIAGPILINGLDLTSTQADRAIIDALMAANAGIAIEAKGIKMVSAKMNAFEFDATDCPDLFPPLVALAAYCHGESTIKGVSRLTHKESNRALTLQEEFGKMGVQIALNSDSMSIYGGNGVQAAKVHSRHDHRIAMACAVAALKTNGITEIEEAGAVKKSYPDFYEDLKKLGAGVSLINKISFHE